MRIRTTIALFLICAGLGGYIYFVERELSTTDELKDRSNLVFRVKSGEIERIRFQSQSSVILCERQEDTNQWKIVQPLQTKADQAAIDTILERLETLQKRSELGKVPFSDYGLQPPQAEIQFWTRTKEQKLSIGSGTAVGNQVYAAADQEEVLLIDERAVKSFSKTVDDLRDRTLLDADDWQVTHILVRRNNQTAIECEKDPEGNWKITEHGSYRGDRFRVEDLIRDSLALKVKEFVVEESTDLTSLGLQPPAGEILLWGKEKTEPEHLLLGRSPEGKSNIYAKLNNRSNVVLVGPEASALLSKNVTDLRDRQLFVINAEALTRLEVTRSGQIWQFEKREDQWRFVPSQGASENEGPSFKHEQIQNAIRQLTFLKFLWIAEGNTQEDRFPADKVTLVRGWPGDGEPAFILTVGNQIKDSPEFYVKTSETEEVYVLSASQIDNLLAFLPSESI